MNGRRKGVVEFLVTLRLMIAASDQTQKEVAIAAGLTEPTLTRIMQGSIPLTPELKARLIVGLHKETLEAAPHVVRDFIGGLATTAPSELATAVAA